MAGPRISIRHLMIAIVGIALLLGPVAGHLPLVNSGERLVALLVIVTLVVLAVRSIGRLPLKARLAVEIATLVVLNGISAVVWTPWFYPHEAKRCEALARHASEAGRNRPEIRDALDREADWFRRRASALRSEGRWIGFTMGSAQGLARDSSPAQFAREMGLLEATERHERAVEWLIAGEPPP